MPSARLQQPCIWRAQRTRRYSPPGLVALAALALACGSSAPSDRATVSGEDSTVDASAHDEAPTWCSVQAILALKCQRCHGSPTQHGAPFALVSYDDTQLLDRKGSPRFEGIAVVVEERSMPAQFIKLEPPVEPLQDEERTTILTWCEQGGTRTGSVVCVPTP